LKIKMTQLDLRQSAPVAAMPTAAATPPRSTSTGASLGLAAA
jgi:hypothetical protein